MRSLAGLYYLDPEVYNMKENRRTFLQGLMMGGIVTAWISAERPAGAATRPGLTDSLDISRHGDEEAHSIQMKSLSAHDVVGGRIGGHDVRRMTRTLSGQGNAVSYILKVNPDRPVTFEIEEMYSRDHDVIAYSVFAGGQKLAFRTFRGCGAGPIHHFVNMPPPGKATVTLRLVCETDAAVHISRVWVWSDFGTFTDGAGIDIPYRLMPYLFLSENEDTDRAKLRRIKDSLGDHPHVPPGFTTPVAFAALGMREVERRIDYILRMAEAENLPVQLQFDSWWGSTPSGSDGRGGYWTDVDYQQIVWNVSKDRYQLSIPNQWSSTPWLSPNHPRLLAFKVRRLRAAAAYLARRLRENRDTGKQNIVLAINLDNEPVYWASGNAGLGSDLLEADFHPNTVARAAMDGVTLSPDHKPLGFSERRWLADDLCRYNDAIGRAVREGLGDDPVANDIYTQAMVGDAEIQYPMQDAAYPFWECGAPASVNVGGEWNGDSLGEREAVQHQIALGRNAAVNAEAGNNAADMKGVRPGYALGQRFYTLYNYPLDKMDVASSELRDIDQSFPPFIYTATLLEHDFQGEGWKKIVVRSEHIQTGVIGNTAGIAAFAASPETPGILLYRIIAPRNGAFETGLLLELIGRAFVFKKTDPNVHLCILAGEDNGSDVARLTEVARFHDRGGFGPTDRIDLSAVARGKKALWVRIEMHGTGLPESVLSWCSVRHVRFTTPWPDTLLSGGTAQDTRLSTIRRQSLLISWRADAERALRTATKSGSDAHTRAQSLYDAGDYAGAFQALQPPAPTRPLPEPARTTSHAALTGVFRSASGERLTYLPDDPDGDHTLILSPDAPVTIAINETVPTAVKIGNLLPGDHLRLTLAESGTVTGIAAARGTTEGMIAAFKQTAPYAMPSIRLAGEAYAPQIIDLNATIHLTTGEKRACRTFPLGEIPFAIKDRVRLRFNPSGGRVYEIEPLS